jgi:hypothetical protein
LPTGVLHLPAGKHEGILTDFKTKDKEKNDQKWIFFAISAKAVPTATTF